MPNTKNRIVIGFGLLLVVLSTVWYFTIRPRWMRRIQPGWSWTSTFVGTSGFPDPATGKFPATDPAVIQVKAVLPVKDYNPSGPALVEDFYALRDPATGAKTWEYVFQAQVDPVTGAHHRPEFRGDIYAFPRSVRKQTYRFRWNYVKGVPLAFLREEEIEGIPTFVFEYRGRGEYTESYAGTTEYPGVKVAPGQDIRCRDDQFHLRVWVEPVTGEILKMDDSCTSGDYIYDSATGKPLTAVLRWLATTEGDDLMLRAEIIRSGKRAYLWMVYYAPWCIALAGLLVASGGMLLVQRQGLLRA